MRIRPGVGTFRDVHDLAEPIHVTLRRAWDDSAVLFLIGPGGAGKSTLGRWLAPRLGRALVDLDEAFLDRIGDIGTFIRRKGYLAYKRANAALAATLADEGRSATILVTSSGFLATDNPPDTLASNRALLQAGYSVSVLPASDVETAVATIVARQMTRSYNAGVAREQSTARDRFEIYKAAGDLLVCSAAPPDVIAEALASHLVATSNLAGSIED